MRIQNPFMNSPKTLAVKLRSKAEKYIKKGHPWVFSESIEKINKEAKSGDVAVLFGQRTNKAYAVGLFDAESPIRIKILHSGGGIKIDSHFFNQKVENAFRLRQPLLEHDVDAYRLLFGENDGFPGLICDVYNRIAVMKIYSAAWIPYLNAVSESIAAVADVDAIVLRLSRNVQNLKSSVQEGRVLYGTLNNSLITFREYGVVFQTDVLLGHKTGFFLDHRENRKIIGQISKGKTVLDVFSYAGGFSVHALCGGAKEVTGIDFSKQALELAKTNVQLNPTKGRHHTLDGDAFTILKELIQQKKKYDIVIIDPPSFAKSEKEIDVALKKYAELAELGVVLTQRKGILLLASCSSQISESLFLNTHAEVFNQLEIAVSLERITGHDSDHPITFPEGAYLKSVYYRIG